MLPWFASFGKFGLQVLQQYLTARVWIHLSNQIHAIILAQGYDYLLLKSTAKLTTMMLSHTKKTSLAVVYLRLKMVGSSFSIILLSFGILMLGHRSAVRLISGHVLARLGYFPAQGPLSALCAQAEAPARIVCSPDPARIARFDPLDAFDEFVSERPHGLLTPIGENGPQFCSGQRQRLALARSRHCRKVPRASVIWPHWNDAW